MIDLIDTHCHLHEIVATSGHTHEKWLAGGRSAEQVIASAHEVGVNRMLTIGTSYQDSVLAVDFVRQYPEVWTSIGIHPHEAKDHLSDAILQDFRALATGSKVVAVGECGLDYYYNLSPKDSQEKVLRFQIETALQHELPLSFHVREAFDDFWRIFDSYQGVRGVIHSFTDNLENLEKALGRGLLIGVNGIATFGKDDKHLVTYRTIPLDRLLLETDAPYLTPKPFRGKMCESRHIRVTAEYLSVLREEPLAEIARKTTENTLKLFNLEEISYEKPREQPIPKERHEEI